MQIILCVTGSVAAVETVKLARELRRQGAIVHCFMSDGAMDIINPNALEFATGNPVITKLTGKIEHVKYAQSDLILVAPATSNVISKLAFKIADNPINTLLITAYGYSTPIIFVPSMHESMYRAIEENIKKLKNERIIFIEPRKHEKKAKFPDIHDIVLYSKRAANDKTLKGINVLISAGATYEEIDPVRGITNRSSGKMGLEIAREAFIRGANVTLLVGRMEVKVPNVFNVYKAESALEMKNALEEILPEQDIFISTAAVSDFSPQSSSSKITSDKDMVLSLKRNPKLINMVKQINPDILLVGFKAAYDLDEKELVNKARNTLLASGAALVVANDMAEPGSGFGSDKNQVFLVDKINSIKIPLNTKETIASQLWDKISDINN
jgi:phosphopantothenoylcysteine decarboxylase/phosphopantothenate--cysteine ligase